MSLKKKLWNSFLWLNARPLSQSHQKKFLNPSKMSWTVAMWVKICLFGKYRFLALKMHYYALQGCTFSVLAVFQTSLPSTTFVIFLFTSFNVADSLTWCWCGGLLAFRLFYSAAFEAAASAGNLPDWMFVSRGLASRLYTLLTLHLIPLYETGRSLSMLTSFTSL